MAAMKNCHGSLRALVSALCLLLWASHTNVFAKATTPSPAPRFTQIKQTPQLFILPFIPPPCKKIKDLEFFFRISLESGSETFDRLAATLEGPVGKVDIAIGDSPVVGFHTYWRYINLTTAFGRDTIDISGLTRINITAQSLVTLKNDEFKVRDIKLRATCVEHGFKVYNNKYADLEEWFGHSTEGFVTKPRIPETVASLGIGPEDWDMSPPCTRIETLKYMLSVGNESFAGTVGPVSFTLGPGRPIIIGKHLNRGTTTPGRANIMEAFESEYVDIREINRLEMIDSSTDKWQFQGITFEATCTKGGGRMKMERYGIVNTWIHPTGTQDSLWKGEIDIEDWKEVAR
ncbi:hypothetical protein CDD82_1198 [Ophiocordyceps australis]|uniref:Uncharacterized protein n=1 Tax=Ophiocordyceps australis TaxID=1399860 RepID=A0A2C5YJA2_9HYPO|nr:hypothetical protein CDD82_1198 [Ophiocordyceps australis]